MANGPRPAHDPLLRALVKGVEQQAGGGASNLSITLWVGGTVVSGSLAAWPRYLAGVVDYFQTIRDGGGEIFEPIYNDLPKDKAPDGRHVHLLGARVYGPDGAAIPPTFGVPWRGRIAEIDAWSFGVLAQQK
jgi:hypothetical protein